MSAQSKYGQYLKECLSLGAPPLSPSDWKAAGEPKTPLEEVYEDSKQDTATPILAEFIRAIDLRALERERILQIERRAFDSVDAATARLDRACRMLDAREANAKRTKKGGGWGL